MISKFPDRGYLFLFEYTVHFFFTRKGVDKAHAPNQHCQSGVLAPLANVKSSSRVSDYSHLPSFFNQSRPAQLLCQKNKKTKRFPSSLSSFRPTHEKSPKQKWNRTNLFKVLTDDFTLAYFICQQKVRDRKRRREPLLLTLTAAVATTWNCPAFVNFS